MACDHFLVKRKISQACWCIPVTWAAEAGEEPVPGQPGLHSKSLSQKTKTKTKTKSNLPPKKKIPLKSKKQPKKKTETLFSFSCPLYPYFPGPPSESHLS
jgi:hypothetical protein